MSRSENNREDLFAEGTGLVERLELQVPAPAEPVVVGFRRDGCGSLYFGPDPVFQFNTQQQLRRIFLDGIRYKAERSQLVALAPHRTPETVELIRRTLDDAETEAILHDLAARLAALAAALDQGQALLLRQVPPEIDLLGRVRRWLAALQYAHQAGNNIAHSPHAR